MGGKGNRGKEMERERKRDKEWAGVKTGKEREREGKRGKERERGLEREGKRGKEMEKGGKRERGGGFNYLHHLFGFISPDKPCTKEQ